MSTLYGSLASLPIATQLTLLRTMIDDLLAGRDDTVAAVRRHAEALGASIVLVGGVAVIKHGYPRPTTDRDFFVDYRTAPQLAQRMMDDPDWERLEIRQYAFLHRPTGLQVDFLVSRDLIQLGRPYYFPDIEMLEVRGEVEGVPIVGLHDLMFFKLLAGRMKDLADVMELCKRHLGDIDPQRVVGRLLPEDDDLRNQFMKILEQAPVEIRNERRLGQGNRENYKWLDPE